MMREEKPTKADLWEELKKQIEQNVDNAWKAGYYAGIREAREEVEIETLLEDTE